MMRDWSERIQGDAAELAAADLPAREMLGQWFARFVENVGIYQGAAAKVMAAMDDPSSPIHRKCQVLAAANEQVLEAARERGGVRADVDPREVMRLVSGVSTISEQSGLDPAGAQPMLRIILDGVLA